jgi:hypothetical protein
MERKALGGGLPQRASGRQEKIDFPVPDDFPGPAKPETPSRRGRPQRQAACSR